MQDLLTEAVTIPSLLHQNDILFRDRLEPDPFKIAEMFRSFIDVLERLVMRQEVLSLASDLPPQWPSGRDPGNDFSMFPNMDVSFLFPNITVANGLTPMGLPHCLPWRAGEACTVPPAVSPAERTDTDTGHHGLGTDPGTDILYFEVDPCGNGISPYG